jgi:ribose 5-phosphate isomerase A
VGVEDEKRLAAKAAAELVEDGMSVGLGTGSTVAHFLPALAARNLDLRCVATSPATEEAAVELGLAVEPFDRLDRLDIAVDGADQVSPDLWLVKGGGGAMTREKIAAAAADRFVVIVSSDKPVERLSPPVPIELAAFGIHTTLRELAEAELRTGASTPDGGLVADYMAPFDDPEALSAHLDAVPGVVSHGLFPSSLVSLVLVGRGDVVEELSPAAIAD